MAALMPKAIMKKMATVVTGRPGSAARRACASAAMFSEPVMP